MKCFDIQSIIKNYANYVIKTLAESWVVCRRTSFTIRIRLLVMLTQRVGLATYVLIRAPSVKLQATSSKSLKPQATSIKSQAASIKLKATSNKLADHGPFKKFHGA